jgi:hypothetical protein
MRVEARDRGRSVYGDGADCAPVSDFLLETSGDLDAGSLAACCDVRR